MDPIECLLMAEDAIFNDGDAAYGQELLNGYAMWRIRGGFEPVMVDCRVVNPGSGDSVYSSLRSNL